MSPLLVDIGVNLAHRRLAPELAEVLERAREAGVTRLVATGTSVAASERALSIARSRREVVCTAGVHPHEARSLDRRGLERLRAIAADPRVRAIGECGLDYDRNFSPPDVQRRGFEAQLELAAELDMPIFLHEREAHDDFLAIVRRHRDRIVGGVVHCFTGGGRQLDAYLDLDLHIGITGWICDRRRGAHLDALLARIPEDRLMIETDAPFLTPPEAGRGRNEPAHLRFVLAAVARALDEPPDRIAERTTRTATRFFGLEAEP